MNFITRIKHKCNEILVKVLIESTIPDYLPLMILIAILSLTGYIGYNLF